MKIDEKFIEQLKSKNDIIEVIGKYTALQKKGNSYWACCPLPGHSEKTPSFAVNEYGQFYKCFGCGRSGDVITFIMVVENLDYIEAIKFLADRAGLQVEEDEEQIKKNIVTKSQKEKSLEILKTTAHFYVDNLKSNKANQYLNYINQRGISHSIVRAFGIGASLDMFSLVNHLKQKGYSEQEILHSGVCQQKIGKDDKPYIYDALFSRLIVPIINNFDNVIGFGGRVLQANVDFAKYKNTQETQVFIKNRTLFNINNLKKIKKLGNIDYIIMVEGYMDVIAVYQAGLKNVVASMGTSLTKEQAKVLKRYTDRVVISYDGDGAGQKATLRGLEILSEEGLDVRIATLPKGKDPDDVIKENGVDYYKEVIENADPLIDYKLGLQKGKYDIKDTSDRRKYIQESLKVIKNVETVTEQEELLKKLRDESGITYESLKRDLDKLNGNAVVAKPQSKGSAIKQSQYEQAEKYILNCLIFDRSFTKNLDLTTLTFKDDISKSIFKMVKNLRSIGEKIKPMLLIDYVGEKNADKLNEILTCSDILANNDSQEKYFLGCVSSLVRRDILEQIDILNMEFKSEKDLNKRKEIVETINNLNKKLKIN